MKNKTQVRGVNGELMHWQASGASPGGSPTRLGSPLIFSQAFLESSRTQGLKG